MTWKNGNIWDCSERILGENRAEDWRQLIVREKQKKKSEGTSDEGGRNTAFRVVSLMPRRGVRQRGLQEGMWTWDGTCCLCFVLHPDPGLGIDPDT